jgi:hypothetical protein
LFERYTERARRSIFFARYEASVFGTREITSEELLLGILREDKSIATRLSAGAAEAIRKEIEAHAPAKGERVSTSVDLPLSHESKRSLAYAAEEAERLNHKHIHTPHLLLGLLRVETCQAAKLLAQHGMTLELGREIAGQAPPDATAFRRVVNFEPLEAEPVEALAKSLEPAIQNLRRLVDNTSASLQGFADSYGDYKLKRTTWTRKEALGHLIDWAIAHRQWVTQAVMDSKLKAAGYPDEASLAVQHYANFSWQETVNLWVSLNRLLIHVLARVPEDKLGAQCRLGIADPISVAQLLTAYVAHCEDIVGQVLARL